MSGETIAGESGGAGGADKIPPSLKLGEVLAQRYAVTRFIARGGMGDVFEVVDGALGENVALKTLRPDLAGSAEGMARFRRCLERDPAARPKSAGAAAALLGFDRDAFAKTEPAVESLTLPKLPGHGQGEGEGEGEGPGLGRGGPSRRLAAGAGVVAVAAAAVTGWLALRRPAPPPRLHPGVPSVAVLPLEASEADRGEAALASALIALGLAAPDDVRAEDQGGSLLCEWRSC